MKPYARHHLSLLFAIFLLLIITGTGCEDRKNVKIISFQEIEKMEPSSPPSSGLKPLKIAISAIISPEDTFTYYKELLNYIADKFGQPIELIQRETYAEVNELLKKEELDAAFVCTGAYIDGHKDFGMELLVAPVAYGKSVYHTYIIVPTQSNIYNLTDLRGRHFAFTDPLSNTGKLAPTYMLLQINETPDSFFAKYIFTYSHDNSIKAVANNIVDGAAVDSLVWEYLNATNPELTVKTRIIKKSEPYGIPPVVVPKQLSPDKKRKLKDIFLTMHNDEKGREILARIMIDRFVEVEDSIYNSVRQMSQRIDTTNK
ncbi:MAG: phosphate/phosphite/phosphonate ABC transporter substrate-binding protein [Proteobacteria bacterium]|nr:phosphate/phosphite/phosphonate ABC transporter substrate-binding protein [Pseudomonadota bacterium]MBU1715380.1 phosphate/phosphite/phosphonate ABC transporter substrate-binding protein [Pseudomonadota bacterium]